jgi:hypothetical protein
MLFLILLVSITVSLETPINHEEKWDAVSAFIVEQSFQVLSLLLLDQQIASAIKYNHYQSYGM